MASHGLDLPNLGLRPDISTLLAALELFARRDGNDFEDEPETEGQGDVLVDAAGAFHWLTMVVSSSLAWIEDSDAKEKIWALAGARMAERCGRMAAPTKTREIRIPSGSDDTEDLTISIVEPSLTSDSLGLKIWGSSYVLSKRLLREHHQQHKMLHGQILELGSGTGLFGIVAAKLGYKMYLTDLPEIVSNLQKNVDLNNQPEASIEVLDWNDPESFALDGSKFDTVVVADPIYSSEHPQLVANMVKRYLKPTPDSRLVVQFPQRPKYQDLRDEFYNLLTQQGLSSCLRETEAGRDEFGQMNYEFSLWKL
ncbi:hypothetical protein TRICI_002030 [Trichomonascus ciferrii]|uniref:Uncharacterized protein n=1 Tax=Trichomonascus ciferrii TaxID=44093 RepID=A0A642V6V2_9ASCO|nr:hypothetical protein TRICI_002030 [Trichomonascus ciferrii]